MKVIHSKIAISLIIILSVFTVTAQDNVSSIERCINLGNMLEAPTEGLWGLTVKEDYLQTIADAGFDTVRIPIKWSAHADDIAPYTIEPEFMERVHEVVNWALDANLNAIVNIHHYNEMMTDPNEEFERLDALWQQIAESFATYPNSVIFELLNEPNNNLTFDVWNALYPQLITTIRESNPDKQIIIGGDNWNSVSSLENLILPDNLDNLVVTFHFYEPFEFTHQGTEWVSGSFAWLDTAFGSDEDYTLIDDLFNQVQVWNEDYNLPIFLGEFGSYSRADMTSRLLYTEAVRSAAEARDFGWCYWEFASGFGIYDAIRKQFNGLYPILIPDNG